MDEQLLRAISGILKINGDFKHHEIIEAFLSGDSTLEFITMQLIDSMEQLMLEDIDRGDDDGDGKQQDYKNKTMLVCGGFVCDVRNVTSISDTSEWRGSRLVHGLKFEGLGVEHVEWFNNERVARLNKRKLMLSLAKKQVLFV